MEKPEHIILNTFDMFFSSLLPIKYIKIRIYDYRYLVIFIVAYILNMAVNYVGKTHKLCFSRWD